MSATESTPGQTLLLIPTELELQQFQPQPGFPPEGAQIHICGFGPIASAARTAELIARHNPARVLLVGIAGTYDERALPVGQSCCFRVVFSDGIGAGTSVASVSPTQLGIPQWPGGHGSCVGKVYDALPLITPDDVPCAEALLTCCAASASPVEVETRRKRFPSDVAAEDMEGFGVALACSLAGVRLTVVRGISNCAGDRDKSAWKVDEAIQSAWFLVTKVLASPRFMEPQV